jgi:preprotein translocase subunit SecY
MNTIKSQWEKFEMMCLQGVSDQQRREAYIAFYAGVVSLFALQDKLAHNSTPEEVAKNLFKWKDELAFFRAEQTTKAVLAMAQVRH